jgi:hypothetical protein
MALDASDLAVRSTTHI